MELLSVIVPVFNSEKTIERCLRSIIGQTYSNLEIIVVDDGSVDQSFNICKNLSDYDKRLKLVRNEHSGVTLARKTGVYLATGKYTTFVDSDDWIERDYYEKLMACSERMDVVLSGYTIDYSGGDESRTVYQYIAEGKYFDDKVQEVWKNLLAPHYCANYLWNKVISTSLLKTVIEEVDEFIYICEDMVLATAVLLTAEAVCIIKCSGYHYCVRKDSLSFSPHEDFLLNLHHLYANMNRLIEKHTYRDSLKPQFDRFMRYMILTAPRYIGADVKDIEIESQNLYYPYYGRLKNARVVLYGAGFVGQCYYYHIMRDMETDIVAWIDREYCKYENLGLGTKVESPEHISNVEYDYIILAVWKKDMASEIKKELISTMRILPEKILWSQTKMLEAVY